MQVARCGYCTDSVTCTECITEPEVPVIRKLAFPLFMLFIWLAAFELQPAAIKRSTAISTTAPAIALRFRSRFLDFISPSGVANANPNSPMPEKGSHIPMGL